MGDVTVRRATTADAVGLAGLRLGRLSEEDGHGDVDRAAFVASFSAWVGDHLETHLPFVAEVGGEVVGMAWLMIAAAGSAVRRLSPARSAR